MLALAKRTEVRGSDSTGFYARNKEVEYLEKQALSATEFYEDSMIAEVILKAKCYVFLGHNRAASVGEVNAENAHPFINDRLVQIHNGTVRKIFKMASKKALSKMEGTTDSEALMHHLSEVGVEDYKTWQAMNTYSTVIYQYKNDRLYFARDFWRPLYIYDLRKEFGIRIFASTKEIAEAAMNDCKIDPSKYSNFTTRPFTLYYSDIHDGELYRLNRYKKIVVEQEITEDNELIETQIAVTCEPFKETKTSIKHVVKKQQPIKQPTQQPAFPQYHSQFIQEQERKRQERLNASMVVHGD